MDDENNTTGEDYDSLSYLSSDPGYQKQSAVKEALGDSRKRTQATNLKEINTAYLSKPKEDKKTGDTPLLEQYDSFLNVQDRLNRR